MPKTLNKYKLLAGCHEQADEEYKFSEEDKQAAKDTGKALRAPVKRFTQGQVVKSSKDLIGLFGANKFQLVGADHLAEEDRSENAQEGFTHPGGQVNTGFQMTKGGPEGNTSGPVSKEELEERGLLQQTAKKVDKAESDDGEDEGDEPAVSKSAVKTAKVSHKEVHHAGKHGNVKKAFKKSADDE